jgi:E3 ubiquitin-protein ligase SHPRH
MVLLRELDAIEAGRRELLQRLMLLDARMDNPDPLDVERAGLCSRCQPTMDGPLCAHCEAEEFFQAYENRLFLLKVTAAGDELVSAEEALIAQHSSLALKRIGTNTSGLRGNQMTAIEDLERGTRYKGPGSALVSSSPHAYLPELQISAQEQLCQRFSQEFLKPLKVYIS